MKLFKLVKDEDINKNEIKHVKVYESENYKLRIFEYESGYKTADLGLPNKKFPELYLDKDLDTFKVNNINIQTTSYGSLNVEETKILINSLTIAIESVQELKEILKENNLFAE